MATASAFDDFLRGVHRRLVVVRALERAGACAAVGAGFAVVLAGAMMWRGEDALPLAAGVTAGAAGVGLAWGFVRRPRLLDAALAVDRQLDLADLLATALLNASPGEDAGEEGGDHAWRRAVLAVADARCRSLSPGAVVLHRFGGRAWGGIALSLALVLTLGVLSNVMSGQTAVARAGEEASGEAPSGAPAEDLSNARAAEREPLSAGALPANPPRRRPSAEAAEPENNSRLDSPAEQQAITAPAPAPNANSPRRRDVPGAGASASVDDARGDALRAPRAEGRGPDATSAAAAAGGGAGGASNPTMATGGPAGASAGGGAGRANPSPAVRRRDDGWSARRDAALQAVRAGRVPVASRDVVREYFRDDSPAERSRAEPSGVVPRRATSASAGGR